MDAIDRLQEKIESLELKKFYQYLAGFLGILVVVLGVFIYMYSSRVSELNELLQDLNDTREEDVKIILTKAQRVKKQRTAVDELLEQDVDFKIGGYFEAIRAKLGLTDDQKVETTTSSVDRGENYVERILQAKFTGMSMKELTELLQELEKNKRVYSKTIEITKAKKTPRAIDATITIATLYPKPPEVEEF